MAIKRGHDRGKRCGRGLMAADFHAIVIDHAGDWHCGSSSLPATKPSASSWPEIQEGPRGLTILAFPNTYYPTVSDLVFNRQASQIRPDMSCGSLAVSGPDFA